MRVESGERYCTKLVADYRVKLSFIDQYVLGHCKRCCLQCNRFRTDDRQDRVENLAGTRFRNGSLGRSLLER